MLVEFVSKYIYLFVPTGKVDEFFVIKAKSIDEAGRKMSKQVNNLPALLPKRLTHQDHYLQYLGLPVVCNRLIHSTLACLAKSWFHHKGSIRNSRKSTGWYISIPQPSKNWSPIFLLRNLTLDFPKKIFKGKPHHLIFTCCFLGS